MILFLCILKTIVNIENISATNYFKDIEYFKYVHVHKSTSIFRRHPTIATIFLLTLKLYQYVHRYLNSCIFTKKVNI